MSNRNIVLLVAALGAAYLYYQKTNPTAILNNRYPNAYRG